MSTRWKARALWAGSIGGLLVLAPALAIVFSPESPWLVFASVPPVGGYIISRFWPRCPHCDARVFGWELSPAGLTDECLECHQMYDGPKADEAELARRATANLVAAGRLPQSARG